MTLVQLGGLTGYSPAQLSRLERGLCPMDVPTLHRFARALDIPLQALGLAPTSDTSAADRAHRQTDPYPPLAPPTLGMRGRVDGEGPVRRRTLLGITAVAAMGAPPAGAAPYEPDGVRAGERLVAGLRDAMLGLGRGPAALAPDGLEAELHRATSDAVGSAYGSLALRLPSLIAAGHQSLDDVAGTAILARAYLLATRVLIKLDEPQLGWMAADRARQLATAGAAPLVVAEAARQQAVLARKAGWHDQALALALRAADDPALREAGPVGTAQRGLLVQCAAYTVAHRRDRAGMRELTAEASAIAKSLGATTHLRAVGGFTPATVQLHLISAETAAGDPSEAIAAADALAPQALPTTERRALYYTDRARAYAQWGRRDDCIRALLQAEYSAPEEIHARPAVRSLLSGLLISGRTTPELRGIAARAGVLDA